MGDMLINSHTNLNCVNNETWSPFHIASRKGNKECLTWILNQNKNTDPNMEKFDINMRVIFIFKNFTG